MTQHASMDDRIRSALHNLRADDADRASGFDSVLRRVRPDRSLAAREVAALAFAATVVLLGAATVQATLRPPRLVVPREVIALSSWRPPSDVLLDGPATSLLRHVPRLGESMLVPRTPELIPE